MCHFRASQARFVSGPLRSLKSPEYPVVSAAALLATILSLAAVQWPTRLPHLSCVLCGGCATGTGPSTFTMNSPTGGRRTSSGPPGRAAKPSAANWKSRSSSAKTRRKAAGAPCAPKRRSRAVRGRRRGVRERMFFAFPTTHSKEARDSETETTGEHPPHPSLPPRLGG